MSIPLHARILAGAALGMVAGVLAFELFGDAPLLQGFLRYVSQPVGQVFMRLLLMLVVPLVFSALVLGVAGLGDLRSLGRVGLKTLAYTVSVSTIAVLIGLVLVNVLRPGEGLSEETRARMLEGAAERAAAITSAPAPRTGI